VPSRRYALIVASFLLERVKGMSLAEVAGTYSILLGITGIIGTLVAGRLVDRLGERDMRWYAWSPALACLLELPAFVGFLWAPGWALSLVVAASLARRDTGHSGSPVAGDRGAPTD
jgi:predicted MFS family arabinose efflux permease